MDGAGTGTNHLTARFWGYHAPHLVDPRLWYMKGNKSVKTDTRFLAGAPPARLYLGRRDIH